MSIRALRVPLLLAVAVVVLGTRSNYASETLLGSNSSKSSGNNVAMTTVAAVPSGQSIIVCAVSDDANNLTATCSDSAGNTYAQDAHRDSNGIQTFIFSSHNVRALASGGTITITFSSNITAKALSAAAFDLLESTGAFDRDTDAGGSSTTPSSGNTATTSQDEELLIGAIGVEGPASDTFTTSDLTGGYNGWAAPTALRDGTTGGGSSSNVTINYLFQAVVTAGQYQSFGTLGTSRDWNACIATYRYAAGQDRFWIGGTTGNFTDDTRWSTTSGGANNARAPRAVDRAIFNNGGTGSCTIPADILVNGIDIRTGYTGTITQNNGFQVFVGTQGFSQAAGTFNGGNSRILVNGAYTLSGGTFRATSNRLTVETFTRSGGTFNTNSGTVVIRNPANQSLDLPTMNSVRLESTLENGLVGYWKFDEGLGRVARDLSGNGNHGGFLTCPIRDGSSVPSLVYDNAQAFTFGGNLDDSLDAVAVPSSASLNMTAGITVSAWINPTDWNVGGFNNPRIVQKGVNDDQFRLTKEGTNLRWEIIVGGAARTINTTLPSTGAWHHLVGRYNGTTVQLFVDGVSAGSVNATGNIQTTNDHLVIGAKRLGAPFGDYFRGMIDDVRIYNRGITDAEVAQLYGGRYAQGSTGTATFSFSANPTINGTLTLDSGILNLAANQTVSFGNGGGLDLQSGTLRNSASSSWSNPATITGTSSTAKYSFTAQTSSFLDLTYVWLKNLNASGMVIQNGATVTTLNHLGFDNGTFTGTGPTQTSGTGTYLTNNSATSFTISNVGFKAGFVNYAVTNAGSGTVTINRYSANNVGTDNNVAPGWVGPLSGRTDSSTVWPDTRKTGSGNVVWGTPVPTPVKVERFAARQDGQGILVEWTCASELENLGFRVWRRDVRAGAPATDGVWTCLNKRLVPGRLTNVTAKTYRFFDRTGQAGAYEYRLESVGVRGEHEYYDKLAQAAFDPNGTDAPSPEALEAQMARVEEAFAEARGERLDAERTAALKKALARPGLAPLDAGGAIAPSLRGSATPFPEADRAAPTVAIVAPPDELESFVPPRVVARASESMGAAASASEEAMALKVLNPGSGREAIKIVTDQRGLLTIPNASLPAGYDARRLSITRGGVEIPALEAGRDGLTIFAPGYKDDYTHKDAFFLAARNGRTAVAQRTAANGDLFAQSAAGSEIATRTFEYPEVYYDWNYKPLTYTPWFSRKYLTADETNGTMQSFTVELPNATGVAGTLAVVLFSYSEVPDVTPDHKLAAYVNGTFVGEATWTGGNRGMTLTFDVPAGVLLDGSNVIDLQTPPLSGVNTQFSMLHSLAVTCTQTLNGPGPIAAQHGKLYEVKNLSGDVCVVNASDPSAPVLVGVQTRLEGDGTTTARFVAPADSTLEVMLKSASIPTLLFEKRTIAKLSKDLRYLATGPAMFADAIRPLLQARQSDGLRPAFVDQEKLFDAYGYGRYGPDGIRNAVKELQPRFLLLVGRTIWDYHDYEGAHLDPLCPTYLVSTTRFTQAPSDSLFGDLGRGYPEVAVGRYPVNEAAGLEVCVARTLGYKGTKGPSGQPALLVSDRADPRGIDFPGESEGISAEVDGFQWSKAYLGITHETGGNVTPQKPEILDFMRQKASTEADVVLYVGHGASSVWGNERFFNTGNVNQWTGNTVLLQATCSANYFIHNYAGYFTIAQDLMIQPGGGICASISTTTYLDSPPAVQFMKDLLKASRTKKTTWGEALVKAQQAAAKNAGVKAGAFSEENSFTDLVKSECLLGDPALKVIDK